MVPVFAAFSAATVLLVAAVQLVLGMVVGAVVWAWLSRGDTHEPAAQESARLKSGDFLARVCALTNTVAEEIGHDPSRAEAISKQLTAIGPSGDDQLDALVRAIGGIVETTAAVQKPLPATSPGNDPEEQPTMPVEPAGARDTDEPPAAPPEPQTAGKAGEEHAGAMAGVLDRHALDEKLFGLLGKVSQRGELALSLMVVAVDHFDDFQQRDLGDLVLREIGGLLKATARNLDVVARCGEAGFAIALPNSKLRDAIKVAEQLHCDVQEHAFPDAVGELPITVSIGLAEAMRHDDSDSLLMRADIAMNASRDAGHNCIHFHDGTRCTPVEQGSDQPSAHLPLP